MEVQLRPLTRDEVELNWTIDRSEVHHHVVNRGRVLAPEPDPGLLAAEPDDIHLVFPFRGRG